jgi:hypothetical protein
MKEEKEFNIGDLVINIKRSSNKDETVKEVVKYGEGNNKKILQLRDQEKGEEIVSLTRMYRLATENEIKLHKLKILFLTKEIIEKKDT